MDGQYMKQKLAGIIEELEKIIASEDGRAQGVRKLRHCQRKLRALLMALSRRKSRANSWKVAFVVCKAIELVYAWFKRNG